MRLFLDVLAAVAHSHAHLIVHRDIKPANVLVAQDGGVKLLDFGIAKLLEESTPSGEATELTREGGRALTPEYAAPEQLLGEPVTIATDVYALGVLLYVLLGGQHPAGSTSRSPAELVKTIVDAPAPRLSDAVASTRTLPPQTLSENAAYRSATPDKLQRLLRGDLDNIVAKALKKSPGERYATVDAFAGDLRRYLSHQPVSARPDTLAYRIAKFTRRHRATVAAGALAVAAICVGLAASLWQASEARHQRDRALALLARSNAVTDFFEFLLTDAGPPDKPQTINSMLARSESLLRNDLQGNPEQQAAILLTQASYHVTVGDPGQAEPKLRRALTLVRSSEDSALRAEANCLHGFAVSLLGDVESGKREIEATLRNGSLPAFVAANCHQQMAFIAENEGDGAATQRSAEAGLAILKTAERPYPKLEASLLGDLAYAEQLQGRNDSADRLYADALAKLTALGRDRSPLAVGIQNNWAIASLAAGDIKRALALYEQSARALRERDPDGPLPPYLSGNLARALELSGRPEEALTVYGQAVADGVKANRLDSRLFGLLGSASAYCELGDLEHAAQALAEASAAMKGAVPPGSPPALAAEASREGSRWRAASSTRPSASSPRRSPRSRRASSRTAAPSCSTSIAARSPGASSAPMTRCATRRARSHGAKAASRHSLFEPDRAGASRRGRCTAAGWPQRGGSRRPRVGARPSPARARRRASVDASRDGGAGRRRAAMSRGVVAGPARRRGRRRIGAAPLRFPS